MVRRRSPAPSAGGPCLDDVDGPPWPPAPADATRLVAAAHALRRVPLDSLDAGALGLLIGQDVGLPHLLPRAVAMLRDDPWTCGGHYDGDLLAAVVSRHPHVWTGTPEAARALREILDGLDLPPRLRPAARALAAAFPTD
ncbi:hypothetical protein LX16_1666 [Stackebrandtia albiflava]|uniref:Uncharacterized protein n=1 Tax=Stackebrandtia albiflava TaxID=406432 RepID=A0A562VDI1_9ACTN|nr:contact-dependent growth inhibition system immunity protein [Stackebrandtia albiflava]TWJ15946.1 hypothetical protein LX16_1666 [Stackebrandtia albiflava]